MSDPIMCLTDIKNPTCRFESTIVWKRWHFWTSEINMINIRYRTSQFFCSSPLPIFKLCLQVLWIDSKHKLETLTPVFLMGLIWWVWIDCHLHLILKKAYTCVLDSIWYVWINGHLHLYLLSMTNGSDY